MLSLLSSCSSPASLIKGAVTQKMLVLYFEICHDVQHSYPCNFVTVTKITSTFKEKKGVKSFVFGHFCHFVNVLLCSGPTSLWFLRRAFCTALRRHDLRTGAARCGRVGSLSGQRLTMGITHLSFPERLFFQKKTTWCSSRWNRGGFTYPTEHTLWQLESSARCTCVYIHKHAHVPVGSNLEPPCCERSEQNTETLLYPR